MEGSCFLQLSASLRCGRCLCEEMCRFVHSFVTELCHKSGRLGRKSYRSKHLWLSLVTTIDTCTGLEMVDIGLGCGKSQ